jgi:hypothetical protein
VQLVSRAFPDGTYEVVHESSSEAVYLIEDENDPAVHLDLYLEQGGDGWSIINAERCRATPLAEIPSSSSG